MPFLWIMSVFMICLLLFTFLFMFASFYIDMFDVYGLDGVSWDYYYDDVEW